MLLQSIGVSSPKTSPFDEPESVSGFIHNWTYREIEADFGIKSKTQLCNICTILSDLFIYIEVLLSLHLESLQNDNFLHFLRFTSLQLLQLFYNLLQMMRSWIKWKVQFHIFGVHWKIKTSNETNVFLGKVLLAF